MAESSSDAVKASSKQLKDELILQFEEMTKQVSANLTSTLQHDFELFKSKVERAQLEFVASSKQHLQESISSISAQLKDQTKLLNMSEGDRNEDWKKFPTMIFEYEEEEDEQDEA